MAKSKTTRYFSKTIDGYGTTAVAHNEADAVRFAYDGWKDVTADVERAEELAKAAVKSAETSGKTTK
jgi:hypothetical protein